MTSRKDLAPILDQLRQQGCEVQLVKNGHWKVTRDDKYLMTLSRTPSDPRGILNAISQLRRLGLDVKRK